MPFLQKLTRLWSNPLDRMQFSSAGLHPFPVEIWKHIFSLIEEPIQYSVDGRQTYQYFFSEENESDLWDLDIFLDYSIFHTRRSIILTCRSWYYMGIEALWSHIILSSTNLRGSASKIYNILKRDPARGPYVTRISILRLIQDDMISAKSTMEKISPLLPNLSALYYPAQILMVLPQFLRTNIGIIHGMPSMRVGPGYMYYGSHFSHGFMRHCKTLSLTSPLRNLSDRIMEGPTVFPNLMNLRINVSESEILWWITTRWHFPALKSFSMILSKYHYERLVIAKVTLEPLLTRVKLTLERIQVPLMYVFSASTENEVQLPKLQELHLLNACEEKRSVLEDGYCILKAPNLRRFTFYAYSHHPREESYSSRLIFRESKLRSAYPSIKEIDIIATRGEWVGPGQSEPADLVVKIETIHEWIHRKETVRIVSGIKGTMEAFTLAHPDSYQRKLDSTARLVIKERMDSN